MKIRHHSIFNKLKTDVIDWNQLRNSEVERAYYIPYDKEEYLKMLRSETQIKSKYLDIILNYCENEKIEKIISIGSGRAILEYTLKINSNLSVIVTDVSDSILRIKEFDVFDDAYELNLLNSQAEKFQQSTLVLLSRIDTEFEDNDFAKLFLSLQKNRASHICFIPAELLTLKTLFVEIKIFISSLVRKRKRVDCGYARTKSEYLKSWKSYYLEDSNYSLDDIYFLKLKP